VTHPHRIHHRDAHLDQVINRMVATIKSEFPGLPNARWVALRLLDGDKSIEEAVRNRSLGDLTRTAVPAPTSDLLTLKAVAS
jgi:ferrous iron transport protein B